MQQADVLGQATATVKHPTMRNERMLVCQPLDVAGGDAGDLVLVLDRLGAGRGDRVVITSDGKGLQELLGSDTTPIRWWTVGILD
jgi:ethanolamine utilization protein EutN